MSKHYQELATLFAFAALPLALACAGDPSDPIPRGAAPPPAELVHMSLEPENVTLTLGESVQLMAELIGLDGTPLEAGDAGTVSWTSSRPGVVAIFRDGVIEARAAGKTVITAECGGRHAKTSVTVFPAGDIDPPDRLRENGGTVR